MTSSRVEKLLNAQKLGFAHSKSFLVVLEGVLEFLAAPDAGSASASHADERQLLYGTVEEDVGWANGLLIAARCHQPSVDPVVERIRILELVGDNHLGFVNAQSTSFNEFLELGTFLNELVEDAVGHVDDIFNIVITGTQFFETS